MSFPTSVLSGTFVGNDNTISISMWNTTIPDVVFASPGTYWVTIRSSSGQPNFVWQHSTASGDPLIYRNSNNAVWYSNPNQSARNKSAFRPRRGHQPGPGTLYLRRTPWHDLRVTVRLWLAAQTATGCVKHVVKKLPTVGVMCRGFICSLHVARRVGSPVSKPERAPAESRACVESGHDAPHDELLRRERRAKIQSAVARIADRQQIAIRLYYLEERTHTEIAERLQLSRPAIDSLLRRGRQALRNGLQAVVG